MDMARGFEHGIDSWISFTSKNPSDSANEPSTNNFYHSNESSTVSDSLVNWLWFLAMLVDWTTTYSLITSLFKFC